MLHNIIVIFVFILPQYYTKSYKKEETSFYFYISADRYSLYIFELNLSTTLPIK